MKNYKKAIWQVIITSIWINVAEIKTAARLYRVVVKNKNIKNLVP